jgi:hypothetical protein
VKRILGRTLAVLLIGAIALYIGDWSLWRIRVTMGGGTGSMRVGVMTGTPLKNGREEYDWDGVQPVDCSRSLFPHAADYACWWLARQKTIDEK